MMDQFALIAPQLSQVAEGFAPEIEKTCYLCTLVTTMLTSSLEENLGKKDFK